jgi:hypothetical protein
MHNDPWYVEFHHPLGNEPIWHGCMRFATVQALLVAAKSGKAQMIFRVMGPTNAAQSELDQLEQLGAVRI